MQWKSEKAKRNRKNLTVKKYVGKCNGYQKQQNAMEIRKRKMQWKLLGILK